MAARLLGYGAATQQEVPELVDALQRVCEKLHEQVGPFVGAEGFRVLLARALHLATSEHSFFQRVEVASQSEACLEGLHQNVQGLDPSEVRHGIVAFLAIFVWLLATFIGEALALRLVGRTWPDFSLEDEREGP